MAAADAVEKAAEVVDDVLESVAEVQPAERGVSKISGLLRSHNLHILAALVVGGGVGAFVSYKFVEKKLKEEYDEAMRIEIQSTKEFYARLNKVGDDGEVLTPQQMAEDKLGKDAVDSMRNYQIAPGTPEGPFATEEELKLLKERHENPSTDEPPTVVSHNIFTDAAGDEDVWDYEHELRQRDEYPNDPYIISQDEFLENESGYEQSALTYFEGDDVLSDDQDMPVQEVNKTVGDDNLTRFGHGSGDPKIVYVRNDNLNLDFEIAHSGGNYTQQVLGLGEEDDAELKHSDRRGSRRFRESDD